jgi:hypothetical protein
MMTVIVAFFTKQPNIFVELLRSFVVVDRSVPTKLILLVFPGHTLEQLLAIDKIPLSLYQIEKERERAEKERERAEMKRENTIRAIQRRLSEGNLPDERRAQLQARLDELELGF